jgi:hypothetical protein
MAETAANLVDKVIPRVPVRQWVLSLPFSLRYRLAYDRGTVTPVPGAFLRAVFASLRRRAREQHASAADGKCGAVTVIQRAGGAGNLNVHFHALVLDGVYLVPPHSREVRFAALAAPSGEDVARVLADTAGRVARALARAGAAPDAESDEADPLAREDPLLAALYAAAVQGRIASGARAGQRTTRLGVAIGASGSATQPSASCAVIGGMSLHAGVSVAAEDRAALERLARYVLRPPIASERLERLGDGRILYRMRHPWRDGTTHIVFQPAELMARLAALVPPPRAHEIRYHGILGPAATWRDHVVPAPSTPADRGDARGHGEHRVPRAQRIAWAELLAHVFATDALRYPRCGSRMRPVATIRSPAAVTAILECLDLPTRAPPVAPVLRHADRSEFE